MKLTDVVLEVRKIDDTFYACLDHEASGFSEKSPMPEEFLNFSEAQRQYWGAKIFSKMEKKLYKHAATTEKKPIPKPNRHAKRALRKKDK